MQSKKAFHKRICVLIAPDANEGGPCILQMYKGKLGDKPKAIMSIRDCHAVTKLGTSCLSALFTRPSVCDLLTKVTICISQACGAIRDVSLPRDVND